MVTRQCENGDNVARLRMSPHREQLVIAVGAVATGGHGDILHALHAIGDWRRVDATAEIEVPYEADRDS